MYLSLIVGCVEADVEVEGVAVDGGLESVVSSGRVSVKSIAVIVGFV